METAYFYVLSTICQTLAGAFGFLVAVALYRMQSIYEELPRLERQAFRFAMHCWESNRHKFISEDASPEEETEALNAFREGDNYPKLLEDVVKSNKANLDSIQNGLLTSLKWTGGTICSSLVLMLMTPLGKLMMEKTRLWPWTFALWLPLVVAVIAAIWTLLQFYPVVRGVTNR